ncbi:Calx-beta domain-containing protein [Limimaricola soesokkakensis]|uniref:Calx-beta domain-containing protein n=1 Tax=Limimaricola soesokkakensis TaxID=1343159 RepID=A0A1X7A6D7_9RHOB|nr:malectin domain-containing carbohydrate-binding protein [Limimaricola soesokkakensis]PSK80470.1 Calx-beta domain-containing protein [Limimaricola soesokkakensis]SLN71398.1 Di-glucose binding within endoplasmic reticulum [Limimaricola soesokkakensis]
MAVSNDFSASSLDFNGFGGLSQPTALIWGADGRLYVTEVDGDVHVLTVAFGDPDPSDGDNTGQFYVTDQITLPHVKSIPNYNDDGSASTGTKRQVTGIDATPQFDASGQPVLIDGKPAVSLYVTSSDSRIGAGGGGSDVNLDTNSGVITRLTQTGPDSWEAVDIVRGLARSEENHATNGLEVIQEIDPDTGLLLSERLIVANGGNANTGAPSNNFAGQQEQPLSAAILEIDLDEIRAIETQDGPKFDKGRAYVYDLPTLDDPTRDGADNNDPFGGNDGLNSAKVIADGPVQIYSAGYRNAYDVEVTEDGRVWTYDNGANNNWGGRPAGEDSDGDTNATEAAELNGPPAGYIATNLFVNDNSEVTGNFDPANWDQMHEVTRSDDLNGRSLSAGQGGALTYQWDHPDFDEPLTLVYGGHANPTRAEGARAGILYSPNAGLDGAKLMVSNVDKGNGSSDFLEVVAWFQSIGYSNQFIADNVVALDPGQRYADQFVSNYSLPTTAGVFSLVEDANGPLGLPADIDEIVHQVNAIEGDYREAGFTDGAIDTGKGSINGLAEYTSSIFDDAGQGTMKGALFAASLGQSQYYIIGRNSDGIVQTTTENGRTIAEDRGFFGSGGAPLGLASIGDDLSAFGNNGAFRGSVWGAIYKENGPVIEILQPGNAASNALLGQNFYAGQEPFDPTDNDLDGVDHINDPFEFDADNGIALGAGERLELNFSQVDLGANPDFYGTFGDTGLLGAALDGKTPNRDANTAADGAAPADQFDGLFDNAGNIIPGANAPILQIKNVQDGTALGAANTLRDGLQTGVKIADDVQRLTAEIDIANWYGDQPGGGRITGLMFGDGTQSNFLRFVWGDVNGGLGLELGIEQNDVYEVIATVTDADFLAALTTGDASALRAKLVTLQLEIADIGGNYTIAARYKTSDDAAFTEVSLDANLPAGVLRAVLDGTHTISDADTELSSGAAIGLVAEKDDGVSFTAVDIAEIRVEAFGNEIAAADAAAVNAVAGTSGTDTVLYEGDDTAPVTLQPAVENLDARATTGDFAVTANDLDNTITVGAGANTITTGAGADVVRGSLAHLGGDTITDFSHEDALVIEDLSTADIDTIDYAPGSLKLTINGQVITLDGENFQDVTAEDAADRVNLEDTPEGLRVTARAPLEPVVAINAGGIGTFTGTLRDTELTFVGDEGGAVDGPGFTTPGATKSYSNGVSNSFDFPDTDLDPLLANERSNASPFGYDIEVPNGTYLIDFIFAEIFFGGGTFPGGGGTGSRVFDINVEGQEAFANIDIHAEAGGNGKQLVRTYEVEVTDGMLNIEFPAADVNQGKLSGLVVWSTSGGYVPPVDTAAPVIEEISLENPQNFSDGERALTVVVSDETGFDLADFAGLDGSEISFTGITPDAITAPVVALSDNGKTATLTYQVTGENNAWINGSTGTISVDANAFSDAGGNTTGAASAGFVVQSNLDALVRGNVVRAINIGTTDTTPATSLAADPLDGGAVDNNRYGGAIAADSLITDAAGNPIAFEADNNAYHTSPKSNAALNSNVDGQLGGTGSNGGDVDLDGSAYHTYRDSSAGSWTSTFDGFANGTYVVELHFAELFWAEAGKRVGDFTVNGVVFGNDYDAFAAADGGPGADKPSFIRKAVTVTDGTIEVIVDDVTAGQPGYSAIVVYDAVDADLPPTLSVSDVSVAEGEVAEITISRIGDVSEETTVDVTLSLDGSADAADIGALSTTQVTFAANQTSATVTLPIVDDETEESAETLSVTLSNASGPAVIAKASATVTIAASDASGGIPVGGTLFALDFETGTDPLADGGFDSALGGSGAIVAGDATMAGGKLVVQTADGDINQGGTASKNDFTKIVDLTDPALETVHIATRFTNPFTEALLADQTPPITNGNVPNYAQQGIVFGTGTQAKNELVKLVWGGVASGDTGIQLWSNPTAGVGIDVPIKLTAMAPGASLFDVADLELGMGVDLATGMVSTYVTLFDAAGNVLGGVRPIDTPGFMTVAPAQAPAAVVTNLGSGATHIGVTSNDYQTLGSFAAAWDYLDVTSPQIAIAEEGPDNFNGTGFGDFSEDGLAPTDLGVLLDGDNSLVAQQAGDNGPDGRDRDYFTFEVAAGQVLTEIVLEGFENGDPTDIAGFIGITKGNQITTDPTGPGSGDLDGGYIFNTGDLNQNLLEQLGSGSDQQGVTFPGFELPLPAGTYTIWLNQGADLPAKVTLNLKTADSGEIFTEDPAAVGDPGTPGTDTVVYTGTAPVDATLADDVENFDGSGSSADVTLSGNAGANIITLGTGINTITTGGGADVVRGTLEAVGGSEITDFSNEDALVISGADTDTPISYEAGSAVIDIDGQKVTFSGPDFESFVPGDGPASFEFENTADGLRITRADAPTEMVLSIANAPTLVEDGDDGTTDLVFDLTLDDAGYTGVVEVTYNADTETGLTKAVSFVDGMGTLIVPVANDDVHDGPELVSVTLTGATGTGMTITLGTATASGTVTEDEPGQPYRGAVVAAFNAGGPAMSFEGIDFAAATSGTNGAPFSGGEPFTDNNGGNKLQPAFTGTIYQTEINSGKDNDGTPKSFSFKFDEGIDAAKTYFVDLYFAEIYALNPGQRVFDVLVEGETQDAPSIDDLDILAQNGGDINTPLKIELSNPIAPGEDGAIDLTFIASTDRAKLSGIVIREVIPHDAQVVSVADASVSEADGAVGIVISRLGNTTEDLTVTFELADGTAVLDADYGTVTGTVVIPAGQSSVMVNVPIVDDAMNEQIEAFTVTLTGATPSGSTTATISEATATVTIADDDLAVGPGPDEDLDGDGIANALDDDVDGDGVANGAETFSYDATNGGRTLINGETVSFDFGSDGTPFQAGFTGALVSSKAEVEEVDLANADVSGGALNITATIGDHWAGSNTQENAFVAGFTANEGLRVQTTFAAPDFAPASDGQQQPLNYQAVGVVIGLDQDSLVKAVFGRTGPALQLVQDNGTGGDNQIPLGPDFDYQQVAEITIALEVFIDPDDVTNPAKATATASFLDANGQPLAGFDAISFGQVNLQGKVATAVLNGTPLGAGVIQTSTGGSQASFDVSYSDLSVTALGEPPAVVTLAGDPAAVVEAGDAGTTTTLVFDLAYTGADATREIGFSVDGGATQTAQVTFTNGTGTLTVAVDNDDLATGDQTLTLALQSIDGGDAIGAQSSATATVLEDDVATRLDQGIASQLTDEDAAFSFTVPSDAFVDADSPTLVMTAMLADDTPLPDWLSFDAETASFSGTPTQADIGPISIKVTAHDGTHLPVSALFELEVQNVNDLPTVVEIEAGTVFETDAPQVIDLLSTATDEDGDPVSLASIVSVLDENDAPVAYTPNDDGTITIDPQQFAAALEASQTTTVTVTYEVTDGIGLSVQNTATLVVSGENPIRYWYLDGDGDGYGSNDENDPIHYQVEQPDGFVANDLDADDGDATVHPGAVEINDGKDNDQDGAVDEDNTDPEPVDDGFSVGMNQPLLLSSADLLANDADDDGDTAFTILGVTSGTGGQAGFDPATGTVSFTPDDGFTGQASFTYEMADGFGGTATATVTVEVTAPTGGTSETPIPITAAALSSYGGQDKAPGGHDFVEGANDITLIGNTWKAVALPQPLVVAENTELVFTVNSELVGEIIAIGLDTDLTWRNGEASSLYQIGGTDTVAATFNQTYNIYEEDGGEVEIRIDLTPHVGKTFTQLVLTNDKDNGAGTNKVTFSDIRIVTTSPEGNTAPTAGDDAFDMVNGAPLVINKSALLANDEDANGDALSIVSLFNVTGGTVSQTDTQIIFTATKGFVGQAGFDYAINDGKGGAGVASVAIDVTASPQTGTVLPITFSEELIESYSNQDKTPEGVQIDPDGAGITLSGNTWKKTLLPGGTFTVDADTVLRFDVTMQNGTAEFVSIGLENDDDYRTADDLLFQVFGSVNIARFDQSVRNDYTTVGQTVSYEISLAAHAGRTFDYLALINDDDAAQSSVVRFSNVQLVQGGGASGNTQPPYIVGNELPDVTASEDVPLEVSLPFLDPDTAYDQLSFSFEGLPDFLSLSDGLLVGTPGNAHVGVHTIEVTATDPEGNAVIGQFDLTVKNVNDAPIVTGSIPNATAPLNQAFNMALPAGLFTDIDPNDTITYRAEGLPAGLSIDPVTGTISGTPQQNSNYTVTVFATDTAQAETSASFVLQVNEFTLTEPILIEVEKFTGLTEANSDLVNFSTDFAAPASGNTVVKVGAGQQGVISTSLAGFGVVAGTYDLEIGYFDENDGASQVDVLLQLADGTQTLIGSFTMNQVLAGQGNGVQAANLTSVTLSGVQIPDGARLVLSGTSDDREHLRFDTVVFNPVSNAQPQFESAAAQEVLENTVIAGDVDANDPEGETVSYAIVGGADMDKLSIDPDTGVLSFVTAADFEAPGDADLDNVYEVTVEASDGVAKALQNVTITVLDADDALVINSPASATVAENQTVVTTVVATAEGGTAPITYAIGTAGADGSLFTIDPSTGALSFIAAPDFEVPGDAGADNVYDVEVIASNASDEVAQLMSVMVTDVDENGGTPEALLRINAWGGEVAATDGGPNWLADGNGNPDSSYVITGDGPINNRGDTQGFAGDGAEVPVHVPGTVLDTARSANSSFSYAIPVADLNGNGDYIVNLYVAELFAGNQVVGNRIFDISVEDVTEGMLDNFDPSLPDGGGDLRILSYEVTVTDGVLNIGFLKDLVDGVNNPIINAIEILSNPLGGIDTEAPEAVLTLTNPATATDPILVEVALSDASGIDATSLGDDDLTLSVNEFGVSNPPVSFTGFADGVARYEIAAPQGGWLDGTQIGVALGAGAVADLAATPNVNEATSAALDLEIGGGSTGGGAGTVVYRINTGGAQIAAADGGPVWAGDQPGSGNPYLRLTSPRDDADTGGKAAPGFDGVPDAIFSTARSSDGSFFYDIPVSALGGGQNYEVRLYLAEVFPGAQGGNYRNFDASLEGFVPTAFNNLDPGALYGAGGGVLTAQVNVDDGVLNIGLVKDLQQNPIINGIEIVALSEEVENPAGPINPTSALEAFAAQGDLDTSQSYATGTIGSAILEVMTGNNNIQSSNFGSNSFEVTNSGGKKISAIFIDVTSALYPDSVFDPDGLGGDNAAKPWQINSSGGTGAYVSGSGYFLPGEDPIPNSNGSGGASNGGYKGAMVKFTATADGGFQAGETVGFSGDMDPNSIAGMAKGDVDGTAILSWDVGGISGHELIGSLFTVMFDDGTTASGQLASDGSSAGSHALATQAPGASAPGLAVNGINPGQTGTYGGTLPQITVTGNPGDLVQITLTKGFNPVTETDGGIADLVNARLARYDFAANNAFDAQTVTVTIGQDGTFDASTLFDYDDAVNNNVGSGSFAGDDVQAIGFVATKVAANGLPLGPTTRPIYLDNEGGPVAGDPTGGTGGGAEGYYQIVGSGSGAYFQVQIEDENANGGTNPGGKWSYVDAPDGEGRQAGFDGNGYYLFGSTSSTGIDNNVGGNELLEYTIYVPEGETGIYDFRVRASRDGVAAGDQQNDIWWNFKDAGQPGNGHVEQYLTPTTNVAEPTAGGFVKIYGGPNNGTWGYAGTIDGEPGNFGAQIEITEAGLYTVQLDGRSQGFHVDYWDLHKVGGSTPGPNSPDSVFIPGKPGDGGNGGGDGGGNNGGGTPTTIITAISASSDDWEQFGGAGSKDLEFGLNGSQTQAVGMRFEGIDIPQSAIITDAYLQFTAFETSSGAASFTIGIQGSENAATFSSSAPPQSRAIADEFAWSNVEQWTVGGTYRTPDISELIETVIGNDGASNAALAFIVEGSGSRAANSFNNGDAPELVLVLDDGSTLTL